jgi:hypothetical protein
VFTGRFAVVFLLFAVPFLDLVAVAITYFWFWL